MEWRIDNKTQEIDFNCVNSVGTTESYGASTANLTAKYQEGYALISDLNFNALLSINGQIVQCLDGYGGKSSCSLTTMSKTVIKLYQLAAMPWFLLTLQVLMEV